MQKTTQRSKQQGFTIIEVLIVLAIAGLILLIVFLAVPALHRNSRNTAIRNDASNVLSGVNEFQAANNGKMPSNIPDPGGATDVVIGDTPDSPVTSKVRAGTQIRFNGADPSAIADTGIINIRINYGCNANTPTAKPRAVAATYVVETGGTGVARQCTES